MHDFQKVALAHHQVVRRAKPEDTTTTAAPATTTQAVTTSATTTPAATALTNSLTTSLSSSLTVTSAHATTTSTTATSTTALINVSPGISSSSASTTSPTTTLMTPIIAKTSSTAAAAPTTSSEAAAAITSSVTPTTSAARVLTTSQTVSLTSSGTASAASSTSSDSTSTSSGLSGAATGGIVAACIFVGLMSVIFVVRKTFIRRRKRKRNTWGAGVYPEIDVNEKYGDHPSVLDAAPPVPEKAAALSPYMGVGSRPRTPVWAPPRPVSSNPSMYYVTPPPASYNNPMMDAAPAASVAPASAATNGARPVSGISLARPQSAAVETAVVRVLYIPTLPDELSITQGEIVQVIKAYDDGWALCANARGEQGVVPVECLDRSAAEAQADRYSVGCGQQEGGGDWRNMKRISSLSTQQPHY